MSEIEILSQLGIEHAIQKYLYITGNYAISVRGTYESKTIFIGNACKNYKKLINALSHESVHLALDNAINNDVSLRFDILYYGNRKKVTSYFTINKQQLI
jgi:hypothetical protein